MNLPRLCLQRHTHSAQTKEPGIFWDEPAMFVLEDAITRSDQDDVEHLVEVLDGHGV